MKNKVKKICILCGHKSPNLLGECGCSYDLHYFQHPKYYNALQLKRVLKEAEQFKELMNGNYEF